MKVNERNRESMMAVVEWILLAAIGAGILLIVY
jgi:hypothetical protein